MNIERSVRCTYYLGASHMLHIKTNKVLIRVEVPRASKLREEGELNLS